MAGLILYTSVRSCLSDDCVGIPRLEGRAFVMAVFFPLKDVFLTVLNHALQLAFFSDANTSTTSLQTMCGVSVCLLPLKLWLVVTLL